jgi:3-dehydroquinate synthase
VILVEIQLGSQRHPVQIGSGLIDKIGPAAAKSLRGPRCAIVSDTNVAPRFANRVQQSLSSAGFDPTLVAVPAGEQSKTLEQAGAVCEQMLEAGLDRQSFVVGLGGGIVGDLSGFVAAIFERGIPHVQVPTTLLAMVDSSIGGKTGINTPKGKNLLGTVHHPSLVIDDVDVLKTLPRRELNQGFSEIIKHAIIADAEMFSELRDIDVNDVNFAQLVRRNIEIKARVMGKDEHDRLGDRALLNFGHTVGHGIERAADYRDLVHGEAISLGMIAASAISIKKAGLTGKERDAIVDLLRKFELPTKLPVNLPRDRIFDALKFDKKFERGEIRFVVTPKIGSARLASDVTMQDIREAVEAL